MNIKVNILFLVVAMAFATSAFANRRVHLINTRISRSMERNPEFKTFRSDVEALYRACSRGVCRDGFQIQQLPLHDIPLINSLEEKARDMAQVWADTILEGDYVATGFTQLRKVEALIKDDKVFAYRIEYDEKGWYVGNCSYDDLDPASLKNCEEGRISEGAFINPEMNIFYRDPNHFVIFEPLNPEVDRP